MKSLSRASFLAGALAIVASAFPPKNAPAQTEIYPFGTTKMQKWEDPQMGTSCSGSCPSGQDKFCCNVS